MRENTSQETRPPLPQRVRAAKLPPPGERARIRAEAHLSLRDLAAELSVTPMTLSRWEAGTVHPRLDQAAAYARLLTDIAAATNPPPGEGD